jgi:hypothetical protein
MRARTRAVERICFPDRRKANPWRLRTKLPVLYAPENKHRSTFGARDDAGYSSLRHRLPRRKARCPPVEQAESRKASRSHAFDWPASDRLRDARSGAEAL